MDAVVLLHGWPGTSADFRLVRETLGARHTVYAPDLAGFGAAFTGAFADADASAAAHATRVLELLDAGGHERAVLAGYDIGSRIAQAVARREPDRVRGLVVTPAFPGLAPLVAEPDRQHHYWYMHLHRLDLAREVLDGRRDAVAAYLRHFWSTWSADPALAAGPEFDALVDAYARPGAFTASTAWYRANPGYRDEPAIDLPTIVLWGDRDPLFPVAWAPVAREAFPRAQVWALEGVGHFVPLEAPATFVEAVDALG